MKYVLLSEIPGTVFGVSTDKKEYVPGQEVWVRIAAPDQADVELSFMYDGFRQYIKIPNDKKYPLDFLLPLPSNLGTGPYVIRAAMYHAGLVLKSDAYFSIIDSRSHPLLPSQSMLQDQDLPYAPLWMRGALSLLTACIPQRRES